MKRVPFVIRTRSRLWLCVLALLVATTIDVAWTFGHFPDHSDTALLLWGLVAIWLLAPTLTMTRVLRRPGPDPDSEGEALVTAFQVGVLGYAPITVAMELIRLCLRY